MKTICIIPARGGSVRIPGKNFKPFHGVPMVKRAVDKAVATRLFDMVIVSTDDERVVTALGPDVHPHLSVHHRMPDDGTKGTQELAAEVLAWAGHDVSIVCVLYPCTPLLTVDELADGYRWLHIAWAPYFFTADDDGVDQGGAYWGWARNFERRVPLDPGSWLGARHHFDINEQDEWDRAERIYGELLSEGNAP